MALIGKNNRKTILNDNAILFQPKEEKTERQKWTEMNWPQRFNYFIDYYLLKCILIFILVFFILIIFWSIFKPKNEKAIFIAVMQNSIPSEKKKQLEEQLLDLLVTDKRHQEINLDDTFPAGYESEAKLTAYLNACEIDLIIAQEDKFKEMAAAGMFEDLEEIMPSFALAHKNLLCRTHGYIDKNVNTITSNQTYTLKSDNDPNYVMPAYGIFITECEAFQNIWYNDTDAVLGIVINSNRKENAKKILTDLLFP